MLETLKAKRSELQARSASLGTSIQKLEALRTRLANAKVALREHDQDAAEAMNEWAIDGGEGDPPACDHQVRYDLLRDVAKAQADLRHAKVAHAELAGEAQQVGLDLANVSAQIEQAAIDALIDKREGELKTFDAFIEKEVMPRLAHLAALHTLIVERGKLHWNSGRTDQGRQLLARAERINVRPEIDYPAQGDIIAAASKWAERFGELMGEPVAAPEPEPEHVRLAREQSFASAEERARGTSVTTNGEGVRVNSPDPERLEPPRLAIVGGAIS